MDITVFVLVPPNVVLNQHFLLVTSPSYNCAFFDRKVPHIIHYTIWVCSYHSFAPDRSGPVLIERPYILHDVLSNYFDKHFHHVIYSSKISLLDNVSLYAKHYYPPTPFAYGQTILSYISIFFVFSGSKIGMSKNSAISLVRESTA